MIVAVGSKNPTKIAPVKKVFKHYFGDISIVYSEVKSGVSDQPLSEEEMYRGALNRAKNVLKMHKDADFGVGIEGGIVESVFGHNEKTVIVVLGRDGKKGIGVSPALLLPQKIIRHIKNGKNLTQAVDHEFGTRDIGKGIGAYGVFTKGYVTRAKGMESAIAFALSRFLHEDKF